MIRILVRETIGREWLFIRRIAFLIDYDWYPVGVVGRDGEGRRFQVMFKG